MYILLFKNNSELLVFNEITADANASLNEANFLFIRKFENPLNESIFK
jgi:hypothetical protein